MESFTVWPNPRQRSTHKVVGERCVEGWALRCDCSSVSRLVGSEDDARKVARAHLAKHS